MTGPERIAYRLRWALMVLGVLCHAAGVWYLFWPEDWGGFLGIAGKGFNGVAITGVWLGLMLMAQALFLTPWPGWLQRVSTQGRPMRLSVIGAAGPAACLSMAAGFTAVELLTPRSPLTVGWLESGWGFLWVLFALWFAWTVVFWLAYRRSGSRYVWMSRVVRRLLAGTVIQLMGSTSLYAWNPHSEDCFCARGSWFGLVFGGTVACWLFGPGLVLLFVMQRVRYASARHLCTHCGYDLRGTIGHSTHCPECGAAIPADAAYHQAPRTSPEASPGASPGTD